MRRKAALTIAGMLAFAGGPAHLAGAAERTEMLYSISAHPDDEGIGWPLVQGRASTYTVFVLITRGEATKFCLPPEEVPPEQRVGDPGDANGTLLEAITGTGAVSNAGPWGYQGPRSPVNEPDKGERHPLGNPWQGRGTKACEDARLASWHWFLDDMAEIDPSVPDFGVGDGPRKSSAYRGEFCRKRAGCAQVWSTSEGARVAFDVPDGKVTAAAVVARVQELRKRRKHWEIRRLPEAGVFANAFFYDGPVDPSTDPACTVPYKHPDHGAVQKAIYETNLGAGPQFGITCVNDRRYMASPGSLPVPTWNHDTLLGTAWIDPVDESRDGAYVRNYGWLFDTYGYPVYETPAMWLRFADSR